MYFGSEHSRLADGYFKTKLVTYSLSRYLNESALTTVQMSSSEVVRTEAERRPVGSLNLQCDLAAGRTSRRQLSWTDVKAFLRWRLFRSVRALSLVVCACCWASYGKEWSSILYLIHASMMQLEVRSSWATAFFTFF